MPYKLEKQGSQTCVVKSDTGETVKCHPTRMQALAHLRALYVNVVDKEAPTKKLPPLGKKKK